jgi:predicted RNA-binding protein YlxR (DUF448 family)/ribosomal protein L30E
MALRQPERTCIGCRQVFSKKEVVRIVAGPMGPIVDYREKLPGRAAYVCPRRECIEAGISKTSLTRALRTAMKTVSAGEFTELLVAAIRTRISGLLTMAAKAGALLSGYSAVDDSIRTERAVLMLFTEDVAARTREKLLSHAANSQIRVLTLYSKTELGALTGRELAGVASITEKGFADAVWTEVERLKGLLIEYR